MVIKRRVSGNNHFQFVVLLLTECFSSQRSKCINSHWSLRWSSRYLFSQKNTSFTSKVAFTNSNSSRKPQENSRFKNSRSILNDPSFFRLWGSFLLTNFISFFFLHFSFCLLSHPYEVPVSYCPYTAPVSRQASCVSPHYCLDLRHCLMLTFSHFVSVNFRAVKLHVPTEQRDRGFLEKWRWKIFITLMLRKFTLESFI